jgi:crotonobetainyl-CoA:carnitine CoA-transferase CaiB-like acyl-CoA transferase
MTVPPASRDVPPDAPPGPLAGVRVLDLSRVLAGPTATQLLGDLGATVLKVENPATGGDDTRQWGPPFEPGADGDLSAYFLSANRNKASIPLDLATQGGRGDALRLARLAHVVVENFRPGSLDRLGLGPEALMAANPALVICSISGWGQTGPNRDRPGYDLMAQGWGGTMALTGPVEGPPSKVGVAVSDVVCGLYASVGILAALRHAEATGQGQRIDLALMDSQVAWSVNEGVATRMTGRAPVRRGNDHPTISPYGLYATADGHALIAVGNDGQFRRLCALLGLEGVAADPRFATNPARLANRAALAAILEPAAAARATAELIAAMEAAGVPGGPVQDLAQVWDSPQVAARCMAVDMEGEGGATLPLIGNPLKLSRTPVAYRRAPPRFGADAGLLAAEDPFAAAEGRDQGEAAEDG